MNFTNFMLLSTMALVAATSASAEGSDALPQLRGADAVQKSSCIDDKKPKKDGYEFEYFGKGKCVDKHDKTYEYGQFDDVKDFSKCAKKCVGGDLSDRLVDELRGFDWNCDNEKCRCLFNEGTLKSKDKDTFDRVDRDKDGEGKVEDTKDADDWFCAKLKKKSSRNNSSSSKSSKSSKSSSSRSSKNNSSSSSSTKSSKSSKASSDFNGEFFRTELNNSSKSSKSSKSSSSSSRSSRNNSSSSSSTSADSHCNQISNKKKRQECKSNKPLVDFNEEFARTELD